MPVNNDELCVKVVLEACFMSPIPYFISFLQLNSLNERHSQKADWKEKLKIEPSLAKVEVQKLLEAVEDSPKTVFNINKANTEAVEKTQNLTFVFSLSSSCILCYLH